MSDAEQALTRADLDRRRFPAAQTQALFAAVLVDDEIDADLVLPATLQLRFSADELADCFRLARQLWIEGFDRAALAQAAGTLIRHRDLAEAGRVRFKHARAKFKHLRYAHALYGAEHTYPRLLDRTTITMGQVQDAYRHGRRTAVLLRASLLRAMLARPLAARLRGESDHLALTTPADFRALLQRDYRTLAELLAHDEVSGSRFHAARKVVGRQVSFWDTLRTLDSTDDRFRMSRWLSAINGRMGALHDDLVERRVTDAAAYHRPFALPTEVRALIEGLLSVQPGN